MDCLKVFNIFHFCLLFLHFLFFLCFFHPRLIPLSNPLCFCKSFLSQKLPETSEDGGQQEGEGPEWVVCRCLCVYEWLNEFVNDVLYGCVYVVSTFVWYHLYICAIFNANMRTCHCLTIIHGVRWIIFRGYRCFKHLVKRMKTMLLFDVQLAMWNFFEYLASLINKRCSIQSEIDSHV